MRPARIAESRSVGVDPRPHSVHRMAAAYAGEPTGLRRRVCFEQARLVGEHDCLDSVAEAELLENVRDVRLDRRLADVEVFRNLPVREAAGDEAKDLSLALAQVAELLRGRGRGVRANFWITRRVTVGEEAPRRRRRS